jgi:hypothetical protein
VAGLDHTFHIYNSDKFMLNDYSDHLIGEPAVFHDDFLRYFYDTILWVDAVNPCRKNEDIKGICWWGVTLIPFESIGKAMRIFRSWSLLLQESPDEIVLTGGWVDDEGESGQYEKLSFDKVSIHKQLDKLISICEIISQSNGELCLIHHGV